MLVAALAVTAFCAQLLVPVNWPVNDPVKEPVLICAELETMPAGNMVGAYEADTALVAQLDVPNRLPVMLWTFAVDAETFPVTSKDPVMTPLPLNGNPAPAPALIAYDEVRAYDALVAKLAVPYNDPLNP